MSLLAGWGLAMLIGFGVYTGRQLPVEHLALGIFVIFLAVWPSVRWAKHQTHPIPAFETFMLTSVSAYALPLLTEHSALSTYSNETILKSVAGVVLFQLAALGTYYSTQAHEKHTPFWIEPMFRRDITPWLPIGMWLNLAYIALSQFTYILPGDINSILRAGFFGVSLACSFLLGRKWGAGELSQNQKINVMVVIVLQVVLQVSTLYLISAITNLLVLMLSYISAGRKIPVVGLGLLFLVFTVLHNGKATMRAKYWVPGAPAISLTNLPDILVEWVGDGLQRHVDEDTGEVEDRRSLLDRASLLQMLCLVIDQTDQGLPFLGGETYGQVPAQLVPRFFWPGKPSGQVSTQRLSTYFGLQDEESSRTTSIGFGVLSEAFANFGFWGLFGLGIFIGWANKIIMVWTRDAPLLSNGGFIMMLMMAWSVQVELPMSNWVASFYQAGLCILLLPFGLRRLFG